MKIDEERQEIILSNGRRVDMHSVDKFLINFTDNHLDSYMKSTELFESSKPEAFDTIEEIEEIASKRMGFDDSLSIQRNINNYVEKYEKSEKQIEELKEQVYDLKQFQDRMQEFILEWGTYLKSVQCSLDMSDEDVYKIDSVSNIMFDFDFDQ